MFQKNDQPTVENPSFFDRVLRKVCTRRELEDLLDVIDYCTEESPDDQHLRRVKWRAQLRLRKYDEVRKDVRKFLNQNGTQYPWAWAIAGESMICEDLEQSVACFARAIRLSGSATMEEMPREWIRSILLLQNKIHPLETISFYDIEELAELADGFLRFSRSN